MTQNTLPFVFTPSSGLNDQMNYSGPNLINFRQDKQEYHKLQPESSFQLKKNQDLVAPNEYLPSTTSGSNFGSQLGASNNESQSQFQSDYVSQVTNAALMDMNLSAQASANGDEAKNLTMFNLDESSNYEDKNKHSGHIPQNEEVIEQEEDQIEVLEASTLKRDKQKKKNEQSKYKNSYKVVMEQAKSIIMKGFRVKKNAFMKNVRDENAKDRQTWTNEGESLASKVERYEEAEASFVDYESRIQKLKDDKRRLKNLGQDHTNKQGIDEAPNEQQSKKTKNGRKKSQKEKKKVICDDIISFEEEDSLTNSLPEIQQQLSALTGTLKEKKEEVEPIKKAILKKLSIKRYCRFLPIFEQIDKISEYVKKGDLKEFFDRYKDNRSMIYFRDCMKNEEILCWILVIKVVLILIPSNREYLNLLPLDKSTTPFLLWLLNSSMMKVKNKELFRDPKTREHLRKEFTKVYEGLKAKAGKLMKEENWTQSKWELFQKLVEIDVGAPRLQPENEEARVSEQNMSDSTENGKRSREDYESIQDENKVDEKIEVLRKKVLLE